MRVRRLLRAERHSARVADDGDGAVEAELLERAGTPRGARECLQDARLAPAFEHFLARAHADAVDELLHRFAVGHGASLDGAPHGACTREGLERSEGIRPHRRGEGVPGADGGTLDVVFGKRAERSGWCKKVLEWARSTNASMVRRT